MAKLDLGKDACADGTFQNVLLPICPHPAVTPDADFFEIRRSNLAPFTVEKFPMYFAISKPEIGLGRTLTGACHR